LQVTKRYPTGDGMFFSWLMSIAIFCSGIVVQLVECYTEREDGSYHCPQFEPVAMLGGAVWATGNLLVVPIVKSIGLGLGLCTWGSINMFTGGCSGRRGQRLAGRLDLLAGANREPPQPRLPVHRLLTPSAPLYLPSPPTQAGRRASLACLG